MGGAFSSIGAGAVALGNIMSSAFMGAANAVGGLIGQGVQAIASYEKMSASVAAMAAKEMINTGQFKTFGEALGAATEKSKELLAWQQRLAIVSPFSAADVSQAFSMAQAFGFVATQYATVAEAQKAGVITAQRLTEATLNWAAATGKTGEVISRVTLIAGQIQSIGKLMGGDSLQLKQVGINIEELIGKSIGKTTDQVIAMREKGLIPATQALKALVGEMEQYGGAAAAQGNSLGGLLASLDDLKEVALRGLFSGLAESIKPVLSDIVNALQDPAVTGAIANFGNMLGAGMTSAIEKVKSVAATLGPILASVMSGFQTGGVGGAASNLLAAIGLDETTAATVGDTINNVIAVVNIGVGMLKNTLSTVMSGFASGGAVGGGAAILSMLGLDPAIASQIGAVLTQIQTAIQTGLSAVGNVIMGAAGLIVANWDSITTALQTGLTTAQSIMASFASGGLGGGSAALLTALGIDPALVGQISAVLGQVQAAIQTGLGVVASVVVGAIGVVTANWQAFLGAFAGVAAVVAGFMAFNAVVGVLTAVGVALGVILSPIGLLVAAGALLGAAWVTNFGNIQGIVAAVVPVVAQLAAIVGGVLLGAFNVLGGVVGFIVQHLSGLAVIAGTVAAGFAAFSILTTIAGAFSFLAGVVEGVSIVLASAGGISAVASAAFGVLGAAVLTPIVGFALLGAAVAAFAIAYATNFGGVRDNTNVYVAQIGANVEQLAGYWNVAGQAAQQAAHGDFAAAWETLTSGVSRVNSVFEEKMAGIANSTAQSLTVAASQVDEFGNSTAASLGKAADTTSAMTEIMKAVTDGNIGAIPGIVAAHMGAFVGEITAGMNGGIASATEGSNQIRAQIAAALNFARNAAANMPIAAGQAGARMDEQSQPGAVAAAVVQQTAGQNQIKTAMGALGNAASGAGAAAKTAEEKMQAAAAAINAVTETVKKLQEFLKDGLDKLLVGDPSDKLMAVIAQISNFGKRMAETFAAAAVGLKDDAFKAAQTLSTGISAASSGVSAVVGLLPKLWEFIQSPAWGEMQGSLGMMLGVASQLINWGRSLFEVMAAASAGVTEESAKAAQALATGISASASAVSAVIGLLPKLWEFTQSPAFDDIMASLPMLAEVAGKLILWGKELFVMFSAAADGVSAEAAAACQNLATGIGAAATSITALITLIPLILDFSKWQEGMNALEGPGRAAILAIVAKLSALGRLIFDLFAEAGADIKAKSVLAAQNLAAGVKASGDSLMQLMTLLPALLSFSQLASGFAILNDNAIRALIVYVAQRLTSLGVLIVQVWSTAAVNMSSYSLQGINALRDGVKASGEGLTALFTLLPALLNFSQLASGFAILNDQAIRDLIVYVAGRLVSLGVLILQQFTLAASTIATQTVAGVTNLATGLKSASDALLSLMTLAPALLGFSQLATGFAILNDPATQAGLVDIAVKLGSLASRIYRAFYLGAQSIQQNIPVAAMTLTDALKSASDAMLNLMSLGPSLLAWVGQSQGWHIVTDPATQVDLVYIAGRLGELASRIYRAFYLGSQSILQNIPVAAMTLLAALQSASDSMKLLMTTGPALLAFVSQEQGWRIVTDGRVQADLVYIAGRLGELAARVYRAFYLASTALTGNIPVASQALGEALVSVGTALKSVMETGPALLAFSATNEGWRIITDGSLQADMVYIAQRLGELGRRLFDAFATAAGVLSGDAVTGSRALADGLTAMLDGLNRTLELSSLAASLIKSSPVLPTADDAVAAFKPLIDWAKAVAHRLSELTGVTVLATQNIAVVGTVLTDMMGTAKTVLDIGKMTAELIKSSPSLPTPEQAEGAFIPLIRWGQLVADHVSHAVGVVQIAANNIGAIGTVLTDMMSTATAVLDIGKMTVALLKDSPNLPTPEQAEGAFIPLIRWGQLVANNVSHAVGVVQLATQNIQLVGGILTDMMSAAKAVLDIGKMTAEIIKNPANLPTPEEAENAFIPLIRWGQLVADHVSHAVGVVQIATQNIGVVGSVLTDMMSGATAVLDIGKMTAALLKNPAVLPTPEEAEGAFIPLIRWGQLVADNVSHAVGVVQIATQNIQLVGSVLTDMLGTAKAVLDLGKMTAEIIKNPASLPTPEEAEGAFIPLIRWGQLVADNVSHAVGVVQLATQNIGAVGSVLTDMMSGAKAVIDIGKETAALLKDSPSLPTPEQAEGAFIPLIRWGQLVADNVSHAVGVVQIATQNIGVVGSVLGDMLGTAKQVLDVGKQTAALIKDPAVLPSPADAENAFIPLIRWGQLVADNVSHAVGVVQLGIQNMGAVGSVLSDMLGVVNQVLDSAAAAAALIKDPAKLPTVGDAVAAFMPLITWAQGVAVNVARSVGVVQIAENSLALLGTTLGSAITLIEGGLKLPALLTALNSFTGINFTIYGPKLDLLIDSLKELLLRFAARAGSAEFGDAAQKAVAAFSTGAGQAIDTLTKALDFAPKLLDSVNIRLPAGAGIDALLAPIFTLIDSVAAAFKAHAGDVNQEQLAGVVAYATGVKAFFETIQTAIDAVQAAAGLHIEGSGFNNINRLLMSLFSMFRGFSVDATAVNAVTAAISSMLGGIENMVSLSGGAAGSSWVASFVASIVAGTSAISAAIASACASGMAGLGGSGNGGSGSPGAPLGSGSGSGSPSMPFFSGSGTGGVTGGGGGANGGTTTVTNNSYTLNQIASDSQVKASAGSFYTLSALYGS